MALNDVCSEKNVKTQRLSLLQVNLLMQRLFKKVDSTKKSGTVIYFVTSPNHYHDSSLVFVESGVTVHTVFYWPTKIPTASLEKAK